MISLAIGMTITFNDFIDFIFVFLHYKLKVIVVRIKVFDPKVQQISNIQSIAEKDNKPKVTSKLIPIE